MLTFLPRMNPTRTTSYLSTLLQKTTLSMLFAFCLLQAQVARGQCPGNNCSICNVQATISNVQGATVNNGVSNVSGEVNPGGVGVGAPFELTATGCGTISFTVTVSFLWEQGSNINWIHGIAYSNSPGWTVAQGGDPGGGWLFQNSITGCCSGAAYGAGYYFDGTSASSFCCGGPVPGNPADNYGVNCSGSGCPTFDFNLEYCPSSTGQAVEAIAFTITDDGETGDWNQPAGCVFNAAFPVIINDLGAGLPTGGVVGPICPGEITTLSAGGGCAVYDWSDGQSGPVIQVAPQVSTVYCVEAQSASGCAVQECVEVQVEECCTAEAGVVSVNPPNPCPGGSVEVDAGGFSTDPQNSQVVFITDATGIILEVAVGSNAQFTLPPECSDYTAYTYNFDFNSGAQFPFAGANVSSLTCGAVCCDLAQAPFSASDNEPPMFTNPPPNTNLQCPSPGEIPALAPLSWTDNCDGSGSVQGTEVGGPIDGCTGGTLTRTWQYTDGCGNLAQHTQIITITPATPPVLINPPGPTSIICGQTPPPAVDLQYDNGVGGDCADAGVILPTEIDATDPCTGGTITYTWSGTSNCGTPLNHQQIITVQPADPPMFINPPPASISINCGDPLPDLLPLDYTNNASGNCEIAGSVIGTQSGIADPCGGQVVYTWAGADQCGNPLNYVQTINILPAPAATLINPPPTSITINCGEPLPTLEPIMYDNLIVGDCANTGTITGTQSGMADPCGGQIVYTWAGTDQCGNPLNHVQTINILPAPPADFVDAPAPVFLTCGDPLPPLDPLIFDNLIPGDCANTGQIPGSQAGVVDPCVGGVIQYVWSGVDECGNPLNYTQDINLSPAPPAVFMNPPADVFLDCGDPMPPMNPLTYDNGLTGDCANTGQIAPVQSGGFDPCAGGAIQYIWAGADNCGNPLEAIQNITFNPAPAPVFLNPPTDATVTCGDPMPPLQPLLYSNNLSGDCAITGQIDGVQNGVADPCLGGVMEYVWTGTDLCGNLLEHTQIITVEPAPPADFVNPPAMTLNLTCNDVIPPPQPLLYDNGAVGQCANAGQIDAVSDGFIDPCLGGTLVYSWVGVDNCSNPLEYTQTIIVEPAPPADFVNPPAMTLNLTCNDVIPPPQPLLYDNGAVGQCANAGQIDAVSDGFIDPCLGGTLVYSWVGVDNCSNPLEYTQTIIVEPASPAAFLNPPADVSLVCGQPIPPLIPLQFDNGVGGACQNIGVIDGVADGFIDPCVGGTLIYSWIGIDNCGNTLEHFQNIDVTPASQPVIVNPPADITVSCGQPLPPLTDLLYDNNEPAECRITGTITGFQDGFADPCLGGVLSYIWEDVDMCGNTLLHTQNITVEPAPEATLLVMPSDITVSCGEPIPPLIDLPFDNGFSGNCANNGSLPGFVDGVTDPCLGGDLLYIWEGLDNCGNFLSHTQTITIEPPAAPAYVFTPPDITVECTGIPPMDVLVYNNGGVGDCLITGFVDGIEIDDFGNCPRNIQRVWEYVDPCTGTFLQHTQNVLVDDVIPPILEPAPQDVTVCSEDDIPFQDVLQWFDNCDVGDVAFPIDNEFSDNVIQRVWTAVDACGNNAVQQQFITIEPIQDFEIMGDDVICEGGFTELSVFGNFINYQWSTGDGGPAIVATVGGTYEVTVTNQFGCMGSASFEVTVTDTPPAQISGDLLICSGESTTLTVDGGPLYQWSTGETTQSITVSEEGNYSVEVTDASACTSFAEVTVMEDDSPTISIDGTAAICDGATSQLTATVSGGNILWSTGQTGSIISVSQTGTYTATATSSNGCTATASFDVTVNNSPEPNFAENQTICAGESVTLNPGIFDGYMWSTGASTPTIDVSTTGTYEVTVSNAAGCTGVAQVNVIASPNPTVEISGSTTFCAGTSTTLTADGNGTFMWSDGTTGAAIVVDAPGMYEVTVTNADGCTGTASVDVTESTSLNPNISGDRAFCQGGATTLNVGGDFASYLWSPGGEDTPSITVNTGGTYSVVVTDASGCSGIAEAVVTENMNPTVDLGGTQSLCDGNSTTLDAEAGFVSYLWSNNTVNQTLNVSSPGTYMVTVEDANGCTATDAVMVEGSAVTPPTLDNASICTGETTTLDAGVYDTYQWSSGQTTRTIDVTSGGTYIVTVTNDGCTATAQAVIEENGINVPTFNGVTAICSDAETIISVVGNYTSYSWSSGDDTASVTFSSGGTYMVTVENATGCTAENTLVITENTNPTPSITGDEEICEGTSTMLGVDGTFESYQWSNNSTNPTINVTQANTFIVTVTNEDGCTGTAEFEVAVNPSPTPNITGEDEFCEGENTDLNVQDAFELYEWSNGDAGSSINVEESGPYAVTVTDLAGCTGEDEITVTENTPTPANITGSSTFCSGFTTTLGVNGTFASYLWSTGATSSSITVDTSDTYAVTVTDINGCTSFDQLEVTESTELMPSIQGNTSFCENGNAVLDAGEGFDSYLWSNAEMTQTITVTTPGTYSVTVTDESGCSGTASATVTQVASLIPTIGGTPNFCPGDETTLNINQTYASYEWSGGQTTQTITADAVGNYTVTVTDDAGCTGTAAINVSEYPEPQLDLGEDLSICAEDSEIISSNGTFFSYEWSTGSNSSSISVSDEGTYILTVTNAEGCSDTDDVVVTVLDIQTPTISGNTEFCFGETTILDAGSGYDSYSWSTNETTQTITVDNSQLYGVTVANAIGCTAVDTIITTELPVVTPQISGSETFCIGTSATLSVGDYAEYLWSTGETTQEISVNVEGTYEVTVTTAESCTGTASLTVMESDQLEPNITGALEFCFGETTILDAGANFTSYEWSNGEETRTIEVSDSDVYSVTVSDATGCTGEDSVTTTMTDEVVATISGELGFCDGDMTTLDAGAGFDSYNWSNGATTQTIEVTSPGLYAVTVSNAIGCNDFTSVTVVEETAVMPQITGSSTFCTGTFATLNAGEDYAEYLWSTGETTQEISVNAEGTYGVTVTTAANCTGTDAFQVSESDQLEPNIGGTLEFCFGESTILDAGSGFATYLWSTMETTQTIEVTDSGTYSVTVSDDSGCTGEATEATTMYDEVTTTVNGITEFCFGESTTLDAGSGFSSYLWSTGETTQTIEVSDSDTYIVTITNDIACEGTAEATVSVEPELMVDIVGSLSFCVGASTTLTANVPTTDDYTYLWSNGETTPSIVVNQPDDYSVTVTSALNCTGTDAVTVTESTSLNPNIGGATLICDGDMTTLDAGAGFATYLWSNMETTQTIEVTDAGMYSVTVTDDAACSGSAETQVTVETPPTAGTAMDTEQCEGETELLDLNQQITGADAGGLWSETSTNPSGTFDANTAELDPTDLASGTYTFEYLVAAADVCEDAMALVTVDINPLPTVVVDGTETLTCEDNEGLLESIGSTTGDDVSYLWTTNNGAIVGDATQPTVNIGSQGDYTLTIDWNGCVSSATYEVTSDDDIPSAIVGESNDLDCDNATTTLSGSSNISNPVYSWTGPNGFTSDMANPTVDVAGDYMLVVTNPDNNCTSVPALVTIMDNSNNPSALIVASPDEANLDCAVSSILLEAQDAATNGDNVVYQWYIGDINNPINKATDSNLEVNSAGTYYLSVIDTITNCDDLDEIVVGDLTEYPLINMPAPEQLTCIVEDVLVTGEVIAVGDNVMYEWVGPDGNIIPNATTNTFTANQEGWYFLTATDDDNGCTNTDSVLVLQNIDEPTADAGESIFLPCDEESVSLDASNSSSASGQGVSYNWTGPSIISGNNSATPSVGTGGVYSLTVTDNGNGCADVATVEVMQPPMPEIAGASIQAPGCAEGNSGAITIDAVQNGTEPYLYALNGEGLSSSNTFNFLGEGSYTVVVEDAQGCQTDTTIVLPEGITVEVDLGVDLLVNAGAPTQLNAVTNIPASEATFIWTPSEGLSCTDCPSPTATVLTETTYQVTVISADGCEETDEIILRVENEVNVNVPSAFSPNDDGINDLLNVFSSRQIAQVNLFRIYDRWGNTVYEAVDFETNNPTIGWDGTFRGEPMDSAVFVWYLEVEMPNGRVEVLKGDVTLMR